MHIGKAVPAVYRAMSSLETAVSSLTNSAGVKPRLVDLIKIRTSQINGCAFCLDMHTRDALQQGEVTGRLAVLPAWRETSFFTERERAALVLAESVALIASDRLPGDVYEAAAVILSDSELTAVIWVAIVINSWNQIAVSSPVGPTE